MNNDHFTTTLDELADRLMLVLQGNRKTLTVSEMESIEEVVRLLGELSRDIGNSQNVSVTNIAERILLRLLKILVEDGLIEKFLNLL